MKSSSIDKLITAAVPPGDLKIFRMAMEIASRFTPITEEAICGYFNKAESIMDIFGGKNGDTVVTPIE